MFKCRSLAYRSGQRGQALIVAMFMLTVGCLALYFLFSAGQITTDKARVTNAADAAAYSGAVWRARVLNYDAYANRAIIANEIALAQYLTLSNWVRYADKMANNINDYTQYIPYVGEVTSAIAEAADIAQEVTDAETDVAVPVRDTYKSVLAASEQIMNASTAPIPGAGASGGMYLVASQVATANDPNFRTMVLVGSDNFGGFTSQYSDDDRMRLAKVILDSRDGFTADRPFDWGGQDCAFGGLTPQVNGQIVKRGGTSLESLDHWDAADTLSIHFISLSFDHWGFPHCNGNEIPIGWGGTVSPQEDGGSFADNDIVGGNFGGSRPSNPSAHSRADDDHSEIGNYGGIAVVTELSQTQLSATDPTARFAVVVKTASGSTRTADAVQMNSGDMRLGDNMNGGSIAAVSAAEVYFQRANDVPGMARADGMTELASLYSPYWQARLVEPTDAERATAYATLNLF